MTEQVKQWTCIKFCIKLEHCSAETIYMIQKAAAMGNWWLAASSWQYTYSHISSLAEFFGEISNDPGDSATPPTAQIWHSVTSGFSKTKIIFEREEIADDWWDSEKYDRAADGDWENCVRSQGAYSEEYWGSIVLCTMLLVSCIFFNKCLYFSYYIAEYLLDKSCIYFI